MIEHGKMVLLLITDSTFYFIYYVLYRLQASDPVLLDEPVLQRISQKYKKTPAQICLKWLLQRNLITVPKSVTPARLRENINVNHN